MTYTYRQKLIYFKDPMPMKCTAHLAYHVHKSGRKTPIIIIIVNEMYQIVFDL